MEKVTVFGGELNRVIYSCPAAVKKYAKESVREFTLYFDAYRHSEHLHCGLFRDTQNGYMTP